MGDLDKTTTQINKMLSPSRISVYLAAADTKVLTLADTWYELGFTMSDGNSVDFTGRGTPDFNILFTGADNSEFLFVGDADLSLSGAGGTLEFALFVNDVEQVKFTSKTTLSASTTIRAFGTNGSIVLDENDVIDIRAKCNTAGLTLTVENLKVSFILEELGV